jgi:hypothetical protein
MVAQPDTVTFHDLRMTTPLAPRKDRARRKPKPANVVRFHRALRRAGLTAEEFAEQNDVSRFHLYLVLRGQRWSPRLVAAVDALVAKHSDSQSAKSA